MASSESSPELGSVRVAVKLAPLASPESSDTSLGNSSDTSMDFREPKTGSRMVSPNQDTSGYVGEPTSGSGGSELTVNLNGAMESELSRVELPPEDSSGSVASPTEPTNEAASTAESFPSTSASAQVESLTERDSVVASSSSAAYDKPDALTAAKAESPSTSTDLSGNDNPTGSDTDQLSAPDAATRRSRIEEYFRRPWDDYSVPDSRLFRRQEYNGHCPCIVNFLHTWQAYSIFMSDSIFLVPFQIMLVLIAFSAVSMGFVYLDDCPMSRSVPKLFVSLGIIGSLLITLRIVFVVYHYYIRNQRLLSYQRFGIIFANIVFLILCITELSIFFSNTPSHEKDSENYCKPFFYTYSLIVNCTMVIVAFFMVVIHGPAFLFYHFNIGGPGIPYDDTE